MGATPYPLPASSGLIVGTNVENLFKESFYNRVTKQHEEKEVLSTIAKYRGGNLLGWNLYAKEKSKIILYDNVTEAKGTNFGSISFNENESIRDSFTTGLKFKEGLYLDIVEGSVEGVVFADVE